MVNKTRGQYTEHVDKHNLKMIIIIIAFIVNAGTSDVTSSNNQAMTSSGMYIVKYKLIVCLCTGMN